VAYSGGTDHTKLPAPYGIQNLTLVLDGQQRLSSLLIGLKGAYKIRRRHQWANNRDAFPTHHLYLDLLESPTPGDDDQEFTGKPYYGFHFLDRKPENSVDQHWFCVGRILDCKDEDGFFGLREREEEKFPEGLPKSRENLFERNLGRLYQAIWKDAAISYYVEHNQDYDRVLDIFVRANEAGTELNKAQIVMAMFASKWKKNAKDEIEGFIHHVNSGLERRNSINLEFVMRSCLVLSGLPVRYRINNFTNQAIATIESNWPAMRDAIERAVRLANRFGIDGSNLTSQNALIPMVYYLYQHGGVSCTGMSPFEVKNARLMQRWLIMALLNRVFGRASEQILANTRRVLDENKGQDDFPFEALNAELTRMRLSVHWDEASLQGFLSTTWPSAFLHLSLLYDDYLWGVTPHEQDHIFPRALFSSENPVFRSLSADQQTRYLDLRDRVGNLELLPKSEHDTKLAKPFEVWLSTRDESFRKRHLIPEGDHLLRFESFEAFVQKREELIAARLRQIISPG